MNLAGPIRTVTPVARTMSIESALQWAFAVEKAQLDFNQYGAREFDRVSVDPVWLIAQRAAVGCTVDGGGTSDPAADAQIIAAAVERLPEGCGGRRMATMVAELARARSAPDWGQTDRLAIVPCGWDWDEKLCGWYAHVEKNGSLWAWRDKWRKRQEERGEVCPVSYTGTAAAIAAKRREYLLWWSALLHLVSELQHTLHGIELSGALPPMTPWHDGLPEGPVAGHQPKACTSTPGLGIVRRR